jgi:DNA-binding protein H-NS
LFFQGKQDIFQIDKTKKISEIVSWWKDRWAKPRWEHLQKENRVKIAFEFKDLTEEERKIEYNRQYQFHRYHGDEEFRKQLLEKKREKYEEEKAKLPEDHHKQVASIQRRTVSFDKIMEIIEWKDKMNRDEKFMDKKKISKRKVAEYLSAKFEKSITEGMIKKYWNGECSLDKSEFYDGSIYTYQEYLEIIQQ